MAAHTAESLNKIVQAQQQQLREKLVLRVVDEPAAGCVRLDVLDAWQVQIANRAPAGEKPVPERFRRVRQLRYSATLPVDVTH